MAMLESERLRLLQESATKFISRSKCNDSSLQTLIVQAQASSRSAPATVAGVVGRGNGCAAHVIATGKGTNGEYLGILQVAQGCAICPETAPAGAEVPAIVLPTVCPDPTRPPFAQQGISALDPAPYRTPCTDPGNRVYFPAPQNKGSACNYKHLPYDS